MAAYTGAFTGSQRAVTEPSVWAALNRPEEEIGTVESLEREPPGVRGIGTISFCFNQRGER